MEAIKKRRKIFWNFERVHSTGKSRILRSFLDGEASRCAKFSARSPSCVRYSPTVQIVGVNKFAIVAHGDFEGSSLHPALFTKTAPKIYHLDWDLTFVQDVILCILPQAGIGAASSP